MILHSTGWINPVLSKTKLFHKIIFSDSSPSYSTDTYWVSLSIERTAYGFMIMLTKNGIRIKMDHHSWSEYAKLSKRVTRHWGQNLKSALKCSIESCYTFAVYGNGARKNIQKEEWWKDKTQNLMRSSQCGIVIWTRARWMPPKKKANDYYAMWILYMYRVYIYRDVLVIRTEVRNGRCAKQFFSGQWIPDRADTWDVLSE